jgi:hypothetical protein
MAAIVMAGVNIINGVNQCISGAWRVAWHRGMAKWRARHGGGEISIRRKWRQAAAWRASAKIIVAAQHQHSRHQRNGGGSIIPRGGSGKWRKSAAASRLSASDMMA